MLIPTKSDKHNAVDIVSSMNPRATVATIQQRPEGVYIIYNAHTKYRCDTMLEAYKLIQQHTGEFFTPDVTGK